MPGETILIIGACGQIGAELTMFLRHQYGGSNIIAADIKAPGGELLESGPFEEINVLDQAGIAGIIDKYKVTQIYNMAAMLSATGERFPHKAWELNMEGLINTLELAREKNIRKMYWPSSIAAFGPTTPKVDTPQITIMEPNTIYGISKQAGERWCEWYHQKFGLDVRSLRYPGIISYKTQPGGGTTDYAVDIYFKAKAQGAYTCFLAHDMMLPMMYMPDAIRATVELMEASADKISVRSSYNLAAMSFNPAMVGESIRKYMPDFKLDYEIDFRQKIAETWPGSIDDHQARQDWGWKHAYDLDAMTKDMLDHV
ncbi:MAG TPA: NAD-dependent epimerase/dehydratase family protein [Chitinophagales bacterium]|nr:NAD-dependent epimerase/dehydratase family protein [Chitinophagales bacterium]HMX04768.1 NAD-dependent epimerase/dehydratase family protein [Chitinophagales bacterium]HNA56556.1 NAD-dependent epimerase/dehydratase family protein [Chitinophagales bacterium]HNE45431.1 NAD-dependent epimerase/dehydratase family protein [Chitinophagales bacterium]HNJ89649.1 NAD-dependent epimerase/dehydratase family protein [Chitinophagales bacterium]